MRYATVCSGIEAPTLAWHGLGWEPVWFSEIEHFPCAVLAHHYPGVPNLGDMTKIHNNETYQRQSVDLICGGTPCQSFSTAGLRKGLDDERGNLALHFVRILAEKRPRWFIWENVPGVFSSAGGRDFASILAGFTGRAITCPGRWRNSGIIAGIPEAYGIAWRVLDAQHFGVPQRRRRVFVVGYLGDWRPAAAVLFESESLHRYIAPGRLRGEQAAGRVAPCLNAGGRSAGSVRQQDAKNGLLEYRWQNKKSGPVQDIVTGPILASGTSTGERSVPIVIATGQANAEIVIDGEPSITCSHEQPIVFNCQSKTDRSVPQKTANTIQTSTVATVFQPRIARNGRGAVSDIASPLTAQAGESGKGDSAQVVLLNRPRRFTPREYERLQGMPDDYTRIPYRGKPLEQCPDGPRYRACGNSMAVPVMRWIGKRIDFVNNQF